MSHFNYGVYLCKLLFHSCRCANGYYGNPVLGIASSGQCRPCPCPDGPNSGRHFAASCYQDNRNRQIICNCNQGYTGKPAPSVLAFFFSVSHLHPKQFDADETISVSRYVCVSVVTMNFTSKCIVTKENYFLQDL